MKHFRPSPESCPREPYIQARPDLVAHFKQRLQGLGKGKKIGLLWTVFTNGDILLEALADWITKRHPGLTCVKLMPGRNLNWGDYPDLSLPELAREMGIDAVIVTAGG